MARINPAQARNATVGDIIETIAVVYEGSPEEKLLSGELKRRNLESEQELLQIQRDMLFAQQQSVVEASNVSSYTADAMQAAIRSAEAAEKTANYTKNSAKYMKYYIIIVVITSVLTFILQALSIIIQFKK